MSHTYCLQCGSDSSVVNRECEKCTLKAEVERNKITISALQRSLDVVGKSWNEMDEMWTRERGRSEKLRETLKEVRVRINACSLIHETVGSLSRLTDFQPGLLQEALHYIDEALLAAKQDEGNG